MRRTIPTGLSWTRTLIGVACVAAIPVLPALTWGATIYVPDQVATIQGALTAVNSRDTVLVRPGTYVENIDYLGKEVVLRSLSGPQVTIIDGSQPANPESASVVTMISVGPRAVLEGFTIQGGTGTRVFPNTQMGGGVLIRRPDGSAGGQSGPTLRNNWIINNKVEFLQARGGGIALWFAAPAVIVNNVIAWNEVRGSSDSSGGGIYALRSDARVAGNEIHTNRAAGPVGGGNGAGLLAIASEVVVLQNLIACNVSGNESSGLEVSPTETGPTIEGNTIVVNLSLAQPPKPAVRMGYGSTASVQFHRNNVTDNIGGGLDCFIYPGGGWTMTCNNSFANSPNFGPGCPTIAGIDGNTELPPEYGAGGCPPGQDTFCLLDTSPLLPENSPPGCGLVGARGACGGIGVEEAPAPTRGTALFPNRPNPFNPATVIPFELAESGDADLAMVDAAGRQVRTLASHWFPAGGHTVTWDGRDDRGEASRSGVYFAVLRSGRREISRRVVLLR